MARREVIALTRAQFGQIGGAAVAGNIQVETGGTFDYQQKQRGGGPGLGLFQMEPPMYKAYTTWLSKQPDKADSAHNQVLFAAAEVSRGQHIGAGNATKIRTAFASGDVEQATTVFCNLFERPGIPHLPERIAAAKAILNEP